MGPLGVHLWVAFTPWPTTGARIGPSGKWNRIAVLLHYCPCLHANKGLAGDKRCQVQEVMLHSTGSVQRSDLRPSVCLRFRGRFRRSFCARYLASSTRTGLRRVIPRVVHLPDASPCGVLKERREGHGIQPCRTLPFRYFRHDWKSCPLLMTHALAEKTEACRRGRKTPTNQDASAGTTRRLAINPP